MKSNTLVCLSLITLIALATHAQTFSLVHTFTNGPDGAIPYAGVTIRAGSLYGTAKEGGNGAGTVYEITRSGPNWVTVPISFLSVGSGFYPIARVVFGPDGHPYGTTIGGGAGSSGVVFNLIVPLTICKALVCLWKENDFHDFQGGPNDGANPGLGDLIWDQPGNIYGTTIAGGTSNLGTVYELIKNGSSYLESVLYSFSGPDGKNPQNGVIFDNGKLYGTTYGGGSDNYGTVFELTNVNGVWTETFLYSFQGGSDGRYPGGELVLDSLSGNLYGTTTDGGMAGGGTVFELMPSGNSWALNPLYSIPGQINENCGPWDTLTLNSGNLYGTTVCDGANIQGSVFELTNTQNRWVYKSLHDFTGGSDGGYPYSNVTIDTDGSLYGTASRSSPGAGTVWVITP